MNAGAWARWGILATTLGMGVALLLTSWASLKAVHDVESTLAEGQASSIAELLHDFLRDLEDRPDGDDLARFMSERESAGLLYVALLGREGQVTAESGEALGDLEADRREGKLRPGSRTDVLGDRVRMVVIEARGPERRSEPPPRRRGPRRDGPPPRHARSGERGPDGPRGRRGERPPDRHRGGPPEERPPERHREGPQDERQEPRRNDRPDIVAEFKPLYMEQLSQASERNMMIGVLVALALMTATLLLWRLLIQRERDSKRLAEQGKLSALGEMSAVLAHEIRNPLASLKGHAQLLVERLPQDGPERQKAERVVGEARRLEELATSLLDFIRAGRVERRQEDPAALLDDAVRTVGRDRVVVEAEGAPKTWSLDPLRIRQAFINLLANAIEASPNDKKVEVQLREQRGSLVCTVRDHGPGLPAGDREKVFTPFFTTRASGTGLGLAVTRRIVDMHDGKITASTRPDGGAVFRIVLPAEQG